MLAIWSLIPLPFLNPAYTSESSRFTYYWSLAWRILRIILLVCEMSEIVWYFQDFLALPFFDIGNESSPFPVLQQLLSFPNLLACSVQHLNCITFFFFLISKAQLEFHHLQELFIVMFLNAHLISHSRLSGSRWLPTPSCLFGSLDNFCTVLCILATSS